MKRIAMFLAFFALGLQLLMAQTVQITGTVTSKVDGQPLPGASVLVKGTTIGTTTDFNGKYSLSVPSDAQTLVISFVGMKALEVAVAGQQIIDATLEGESVGLDEVVVVAYGTGSKRSITGAITSLDSKTLNNQIAISPLRALQGSAPGVNVLTTGGQPGEDPTIRIRGIGSVNASADPLIVVDGVVYNGMISNISADQIESINTLKDASATSLYGSRAANGVILITTKSGRYNSPTTITLASKTGFSSPAVKSYDLVGAGDYMKLAWESLRNAKVYIDGTDMDVAGQEASEELVSYLGYNPYNVSNPIDANGNVVNGANLLWDTDWYNELIRKRALYNDYSLSVQGGSEKVTYFFSGNYIKQQGSVIESDFNRYSGRMNVEAKVKKWLDAGFNASYSSSKQNYPEQSGSSYTSTMQWVNSLSSIYPVYAHDEDGNLKLDNDGNLIYDYGNAGGGQDENAVRPLFGGENAVSSTRLNDILYKRKNFFSNIYLNVKFLKTFSFKTTFGFENYEYDAFEYDHYKYGSAGNVGGRITQRRNVTESYTLTNKLNYTKEFDNHTISADAIFEAFNYNYDYLRAQATGFLPNVKVLSGSTKPESVGGYINEERLISYLGRVDYSFKKRYYLNLSYRRDGSTRFSSDRRWGNFYSLGANWIISDEAFLIENDIVSLLKLRVSYGELGNNRGIGYFPYLSAFNTGWNNGDNTGVLQGGIVDKNITWEKTGLFNIGLDFGVLNNRITGTFEYYNKKSIDLIFDKPLSPSTGNIKVTTNIGSVRNRGWEFSLVTKNVITKTLEWTTTFNISQNKNEILSLSQKEIIKGTKKLMVGQSVYDFYMPKYLGVDPADGYAMWKKTTVDNEGNETGSTSTKVYSEATKYYVGSSLPDYIGGFSSYLKVSNFDLNLMFNFSVGGKLYDYSYAGLMTSMSSAGYQVASDIKDRWQKPGDITNTPLLLASNNDFTATSRRFLFKNDYLRLKALTLGYNLPQSLIKKLEISSARIYFQADNLLTFQSHKGIDPEQNLEGTTDSRSYLMKTLTLGINLTF